MGMLRKMDKEKVQERLEKRKVEEAGEDKAKEGN